MELTQEQKDMLEGKHGNAVKKSMSILVTLGEIYGAKRLIPVTSVQISGVSYDNLGDAGLEFLDEMAKDGKIRVKTTLNPAGMDMENWKALGIDPEFARKQKLVIEFPDETIRLDISDSRKKHNARFIVRDYIKETSFEKISENVAQKSVKKLISVFREGKHLGSNDLYEKIKSKKVRLVDLFNETYNA